MRPSLSSKWSSRSAALVAGCLLVIGACGGTSVISPSVSPTATPGPTQTPRPTRTALPTGMPRPTGTPRPTPSPTPVATSALTPAPSQTPTQAPPASTGAPSLPPTGAVIFSDDFSGATKYLSTGTQADYGGGQYANGVFDLTAEPRPDYINFRDGSTLQVCAGDTCSYPDVINNQLATATVEVDATQVSGSNGGSFGIACQYTGTLLSNFYGLTISADGRQYAINHYFSPGDFPVPYLAGGASRGDVNSAINQGTGATNHLRADCGRQVMNLWVNGQLVASATLPQPGDSTAGIALVAAPGPDGPVDVQFDNLVVSELSQEPVALASQGVIFADALSSDDGIWPTGDLDSGSAEFTNGRYRVTIPNPSQFQEIYPGTMSPPSDTSTQVDATFVAGSESSLMGLICRSGTDGYYVLQVAPVAQYSLYRAAQSSTFLVDWTQNDAINTGAGQTNSVRLDCVGDTLTAYVNGTQIAQATDSVLPEGNSGLGAVSTPTEGGTVYDFANLAISYPQP